MQWMGDWALNRLVVSHQVWWNEAQQKWVGNDVPDFKVDSKPSDHMRPFIMNPEAEGTAKT
jgi:hypothetical protein